jgi:hypothetical protein
MHDGQGKQSLVVVLFALMFSSPSVFFIAFNTFDKKKKKKKNSFFF